MARGWIIGMSVAVACGPGTAGSESGDSGTTQSMGEAGDSTAAVASATSDGSSGDATTTDPETGTADDSGGSTTGSSSTPFGLCEDEPLSIEVATFGTPDGPLDIDFASMGLAACTWGFYVSFVSPAFEGAAPREVVVLIAPDGGPGVLEGEYPASLPFEGDATGTAVLLEPFEIPEQAVDAPEGHAHVQIEIHEGGWDISAEVDLIHCGAIACFCPCR